MAQILIVDDEPAIREGLRALLERLGHEVTEAGNGLEGIERFGQGAFDLVVSDVMMPQMNGFDFLRALQPQIHERVPFLILSSHDDGEGVEAAIYAGAFDYLFKPFEEEKVRAVVDGALEQARQWAAGHGGAASPPPPMPVAEVSSAPVPAGVRDATPDGAGVFARGEKIVTVSTPGQDGARSAGSSSRPAGLRGLLRRFGRRR